MTRLLPMQSSRLTLGPSRTSTAAAAAATRPRSRSRARRLLRMLSLPGLSPSQAASAPGSSDGKVHASRRPYNDEYSYLKDRIDAPPLLLPPVSTETRVVIVRHGQSTWNAANRVQGSSDQSVLTDKGLEQARATQRMLKDQDFDLVYASPLARARLTADIVLEGRDPVPRENMPALREIDLYSFQGLLKMEVKTTYPAQYRNWQRHPERFELDGHSPVREVWHRASLAWRAILTHAAAIAHPTGPASSPLPSAPASAAPPRSDPFATSSASSSGDSSGEDAPELDTAPRQTQTLLIVAHNNTNQALIATALCLPCTHFRRLIQNNAAVSSLVLQPSAWPGASPQVILECLNQAPGAGLFKVDEKVVARVVLLAETQDESSRDALAALVANAKVDIVMSGANQSAQDLTRMVVDAQVAAGHPLPHITPLVNAASTTAWEKAWVDVLHQASVGGGSCVAVITDENTVAALLCKALCLGAQRITSFKVTPGSISLLEFHGTPSSAVAAVRCFNSTAHLQAASDDQ